ncbi:Cytochrome c biogenesis protein transmembrane region [Candidatus Saccharibacteria bacterium RAAC3_TM7_1]|nr:Cytochrome c biogenesis protein transmembrane region [Candidatus Saccharibacteria bacterium RAAC3_TM7_1]
MDIVSTASLVTAFLAGIAALFAPCCIGVLLPAYLASVFKTKSKIFLMTFFYYLGLLTVFLPLGLGMAGLGALFSRYHVIIFTLGGLFMIALGVALVLGRSYMLPMRIKPQLKGHDPGSLYVLGIFSGIATSCCAPVLAGVLALSAIPGSWVLGPVYSLAFVTGLVLPLFIMAFLIDKANVMEKFSAIRRVISYRLAGRAINVNLSHLISGFLFIAIGLFIIIFERASPEGTSVYQLKLNLLAAEVTRTVSQVTQLIPEYAWAVIFTLLFGLVAWVAYRQARRSEIVKGRKDD